MSFNPLGGLNILSNTDVASVGCAGCCVATNSMTQSFGISAPYSLDGSHHVDNHPRKTDFFHFWTISIYMRPSETAFGMIFVSFLNDDELLCKSMLGAPAFQRALRVRRGRVPSRGVTSSRGIADHYWTMRVHMSA